ncbi:erythromycin esterase family protein [Micromonospora sp. NPDC047738]|uniref:erythromycin esterase family protein n=1 Tax=Micromonospora sp. NPDC047738 TaxID=3155741 RepID=UPI0033D2EEF8
MATTIVAPLAEEREILMNQRKRFGDWPLRLLTAAVAAVVVLPVGLAAHAQIRGRAQPVPEQPVTGWVRHNAATLSSIDPAAALDDLAPVGRSVGDAEIVGLGESMHGTAEETRLKHRALRFLVERMGFRSIAWEEQWTTGPVVNEYIRFGQGDLDTVMARLGPQWQTREVADVLRWLRDFNAGRSDKVHFVGVEYYWTWLEAYDAVDAYVARAAAQRLPELRSHLGKIRPAPGSTVLEHFQKYQAEPDKEPYIRQAHEVYDLVARLPHQPGDRAHALALHNARQIVSFYEHYNLSADDALVYRDARAAENLRWWREFSGDKIAYWAASPHTANAPQLRMGAPGQTDKRFPSAGSYLRRWYGQKYRSIGFTFDHGTVNAFGTMTPMPPPAADWFEQPLGRVGVGQFTLDLHTAAPPPVRNWLDAPIKTRGLPDGGPDAFMDGGTLRQWFDVIVHRQEVTPAQPA